MHFDDVFMHHSVVKYELHGRMVVVSGGASGKVGIRNAQHPGSFA
jgi:hypothetical protein